LNVEHLLNEVWRTKRVLSCST